MTEKNIALVSGITGQAGSYVSDLLLDFGYEVHGIVRRQRNYSYENLQTSFTRGLRISNLHDGDILDQSSMNRIVNEVKPTEVYCLAAQSFVPHSFTNPEYTIQTNILGTLHILNAVRDFSPKAKFIHASSSEMFGNPVEVPQNLNTPFRPVSVYGMSKLAAHHLVRNYHEAYGIHALNAVSYNYESPRRSSNFVTKKVAMTAARGEKVKLGSLDSSRDWGWAPDYVKGWWSYMQQAEWRDAMLFATGERHTVAELVDRMYGYAGFPNPRDNGLVEQDPALLRPAELRHLLGDPSETERILGWKRTKNFDDICREMVKHELRVWQKEKS